MIVHFLIQMSLGEKLKTHKMYTQALLSLFLCSSMFASCNNNSNLVGPSTGPAWTQQLQGSEIPCSCTIGSVVIVGISDAPSSRVYVVRSTDDGSVWHEVAEMPVDNHSPGIHLYLDPSVTFLTDGTRVLLGIGGCNRGGIYISDDNGVNWSDNGIHWPESDFTAGAEDINSFALPGDIIFAGTNHGVFRSTDNGANWNALNFGLSYGSVDGIYGHAPQVMMLATMGNGIFAGTTGGGVFHSIDDGDSWIPVNNGLASQSIYGLAGIGNYIFAGAFQWSRNSIGGVFLSTNYGASWTSVDSGLTQRTVNVLASQGRDLFAGTNDGVSVSTN